jgi:protein phosphatase
MTETLGPIVFGDKTHEGPREVNQDTVLSIRLPDERWLLAVADGMGGLEDGGVASQTALGALYRSLSKGADLLTAANDANQAVLKAAEGRVMGTTLVAALINGTRAEIINVGDSRAYCSDSLGLIQITRDHSMAAEAAQDATVLADELETGPSRWAGALARYLGAEDSVRVDRFGPVELVEGGWLLLCSDGLHGVMAEKELDSFFKDYTDAEKAASGLVEKALERNTGDNISAVVAHWPQRSPALVSRPGSRSRSKARSDLQAKPRGKSRARSKGRKKGTVLQGKARPRSVRSFITLAFKAIFVVIPLMLLLAFLFNRFFPTSP